MDFKLKMGFLREEKVVKSQCILRFAVMKVTVNRFYIAADLKMMRVSFSIEQRYYLGNELMEERTTSIYGALRRQK